MHNTVFGRGNPVQTEDLADAVEAYLYETFRDCTGKLREICLHTLNAGGKRVRPSLTIHCGRIFGDPGKPLLQAAVAMELVHMASLIHDDIIDRAALRRNRATVFNRWGAHLAVLSGDYLFAKVFEILARPELNPVLGLTVAAIQKMCQGEIDQAGDNFNPEVDRERYLERIYLKTGSLLECCCLAGALIGGAGTSEVELLGQFGREVGIAYQIIDDLLDITGDPVRTGKPAWEDFGQGTLTLPVILLMERATHRDWVRRRIEERETGKEIQAELKERLIQAGCIEEARMLAAERIGRARRAVAQLPVSEHTIFLNTLADRMLTRGK
jgi:heptaprenyl diphosphate synthase